MIKELIKKYEFNPRTAGLFVNPFYFARKGIWQFFYDNPMYITGKLLDVGCGSKPYRSFFPAADYIGMEIHGSNHSADYYYNGKTFPFPDGEFDTVLCSQVLEHVFNPDEFLSEIRRVLKPNGKLILTVPFIWNEHEQPNDYARYSSFGIKHLLDKNGFEVLHQQKSTTGIQCYFPDDERLPLQPIGSCCLSPLTVC